MEMILGGLAFTLMMTSQILAVVAVHNGRFVDGSGERIDDARVRNLWLFGG